MILPKFKYTSAHNITIATIGLVPTGNLYIHIYTRYIVFTCRIKIYTDIHATTKSYNILKLH